MGYGISPHCMQWGDIPYSLDILFDGLGRIPHLSFLYTTVCVDVARCKNEREIKIQAASFVT